MRLRSQLLSLETPASPALLSAVSGSEGSRPPHLAASGDLCSCGAWSGTYRGRTQFGWDKPHGRTLGPPTPAWSGGQRLTHGDGLEGGGAVPCAVAGPALIRPVVFQGLDGPQALDGHLVEGLLAQDLGVRVLRDQQHLGFITSRKSRVCFRVSGCPAPRSR